jgi:CubicO group peptidase (beta-lactamase class C family)
MKRIITLGLFILVILTLHFSAFAQSNRLSETFPSGIPEQHGVNSIVLDSMMQFIKQTNQNIHHLTIIRNKQTMLDVDVYPYSSKYLHDIASVTKSITSLLIGIAIDKGFIKDENEPVLKFFSDINPPNPLLAGLTVRHLLTMRSGFDCSVEGGEKALNNMRQSKDWPEFIFSLPLINKPGDKFSYCSCNTYLLAEIINRTTKMTPHEFARKYLFEPLRINGSKWLVNYKGINHGWGDLFLYPTDMAKIGQMVLDKGKWQGRHIVSEHWIKKSLETVSSLPDDKGYGYGWWTNDKVGYYEAAGRGRQTISVLPSRNMVVIMTGGEFDAGTIGHFILSSIKGDDSLPANPDGYGKLKKSIKEISSPPPFKPGRANSTMVQKLDKRMILLEKNVTQIDSLSFDFSSKERPAVTLYKNGSKEKYPFVISAVSYAVSLDPTLQIPVALQASFQIDNEFMLHFNQLCRINNFYFHFTLAEDGLTTSMEEKSNFIKINIRSWIK